VFSRFAFPPLVDISLANSSPKAIIRDDGPEFRSENFQKVISKYRIKEVIIPPGKTFKNGYVESFHSRMREELLDAEVFESPYSALGGRTPFEVFKKVGQLDMRKLKCNIISVQNRGISNYRLNFIAGYIFYFINFLSRFNKYGKSTFF